MTVAGDFPPPRLLAPIAGFADELTAIRHDLHRHPELGFEETRTAAIIADKLTTWGVEVHTGVGRTGVVGVLAGREAGPRSVALRADIDALPMPEETGLAYASLTPGRFHGCGHDAHVAILLGAARYLAVTRNFSGTAVFVFQPAEEGLGGARAMIADGLFERFPFDEIYGLHNSPYIGANRLQVAAGPALAGADFFDITLKGVGAHAAHPDVARDPIPAAGELILALQTIVARNVPATEPAVVSITKLAAGSAYNVIPETATLSGTVRAFSDSVRVLIRERLRSLAEGVAAAHGLSAEIRIDDRFSALHNPAEQVEIVAAIGREILGPERVSTAPRLSLGSEDFAEFLKRVPGAFFSLGHSGTVPLHNPGFVLGDESLPVGATLFARLIETRLPLA